MPTSTPSRPPRTPHLPEAAIQEALSSHGAEAALALSELAANPALPRLARLLGPHNLGRALVDSPLDLAQAATELAGMLPVLEAAHSLSLRPHLTGKIFSRSLPSFLKGMREIQRRGLEQSLTEFEALLPEAARHALPRPFPETRGEAETLLALLYRLEGKQANPPEPGILPIGCEVEIPHLPGYPAGGAYLLALFSGLPLGEDELVEFSLPPSLGGATQVRLIDSLAALGLLPPSHALSLHITCETPADLAVSGELARGMALISFALAYLWSADRRLSAGQIFKNFRLKHRGITGLRWPAALGAEYRLANVCTAPNEPGVLGESLRAHEAQIGLAERLHAALIGHCLGSSGPWGRLRAGIEAFVAAYGLEELVERERNVTGELATLYRANRTAAQQGELLGIIEKTLGAEGLLG